MNYFAPTESAAEFSVQTERIFLLNEKFSASQLEAAWDRAAVDVFRDVWYFLPGPETGDIHFYIKDIRKAPELVAMYAYDDEELLRLPLDAESMNKFFHSCAPHVRDGDGLLHPGDDLQIILRARRTGQRHRRITYGPEVVHEIKPYTLMLRGKADAAGSRPVVKIFLNQG